MEVVGAVLGAVSWTLVATYAGQQVHRQTLARTTLATTNWTVTIPTSATRPLERAGYQ